VTPYVPDEAPEVPTVDRYCWVCDRTDDRNTPEGCGPQCEEEK
jgi:hypothetical protein